MNKSFLSKVKIKIIGYVTCVIELLLLLLILNKLLKTNKFNSFLLDLLYFSFIILFVCFVSSYYTIGMVNCFKHFKVAFNAVFKHVFGYIYHFQHFL